MTRTVMLEPALLDAKYEAPRQILGAPWPGIDGPMLAAILLSANHGLAEGENDRAMIAGFGRAHFAHDRRSEEPTSELPSLMRISYAVFCFKKKTKRN